MIPSQREEGRLSGNGVSHRILHLELNQLTSKIENSLVRILCKLRRSAGVKEHGAGGEGTGDQVREDQERSPRGCSCVDK
jgi:hypothetical protein